MNVKAVQQQDISAKLVAGWEQVCDKIAALAEALPAEKFAYSPAGGVRTAADVLRHVAFWNLYVADIARGKKADDSTNELAKEKYATKAQIIAELKRSAAQAADALKGHDSGLNGETAELVLTFIEHTCEHYGQLVVYARMSGIVPPSSRG